MSLAFEHQRVLPPDDTVPVVDDTVPVAVDNKISAGEALRGTLTSDDFLRVEERLEGAFAAMQSDGSREAGECIAYALGINKNDGIMLDHLLAYYATAIASRDGSVRVVEGGSGLQMDAQETAIDILWEGKTNERHFRVIKKLGHIVLKDGSIKPDGVVYSLLSNAQR
jgi:hypothetical protein